MIDHNLNAIIIDFGFSLTVAEAQVIETQAGNHQYLAKELQWDARKSFQTDIYALGLLMLEVCTQSCYSNLLLS